MASKRIVQVGLGAMGQAIGRSLMQRDDCQLVGAVDQSANKQNVDLGELLGYHHLGVSVGAEPGQLPEGDLAIVATTSEIEQVVNTVESLVRRSFNVLTICEEAAFPWFSHPSVAGRIDSLAEEYGVTVLGSGANPGIIMDTLPLLLSALTQQVEHVEIRRRTDMSHYSNILTKFGLGLTADQFHAARNSGQVIGHVGFRQAIAAIADGLDWPLDSIEVDVVQPGIISPTSRTGDHIVIEPGTLATVVHSARAILNKRVVIDLQITFGFFEDSGDIKAGDDYRIRGSDQILNLSSKNGFDSFSSTVAVTVNTAMAVIDAKSGLITMADLPVRAISSKGSRLHGSALA